MKLFSRDFFRFSSPAAREWRGISAFDLVAVESPRAAVSAFESGLVLAGRFFVARGRRFRARSVEAGRIVAVGIFGAPGRVVGRAFVVGRVCDWRGAVVDLDGGGGGAVFAFRAARKRALRAGDFAGDGIFGDWNRGRAAARFAGGIFGGFVVRGRRRVFGARTLVKRRRGGLHRNGLAFGGLGDFAARLARGRRDDRQRVGIFVFGGGAFRMRGRGGGDCRRLLQAPKKAPPAFGRGAAATAVFALPWLVIWPALAAAQNPEWFARWMEWQVEQARGLESPAALAANVGEYVKLVAWAAFPLWILAAAAGFAKLRPTADAAAAATGWAAWAAWIAISAAWIARGGGEIELFAGLPALALLAAGCRLPKSGAAALDWFALLVVGILFIGGQWLLFAAKGWGAPAPLARWVEEWTAGVWIAPSFWAVAAAATAVFFVGFGDIEVRPFERTRAV